MLNLSLRTSGDYRFILCCSFTCPELHCRFKLLSAFNATSILPWWHFILCRLKDTVLMDLNLGPSFLRPTLASSPKKFYKKATRSLDYRWDPTSEHPRRAWHQPVFQDRSSWNKRGQEWTTNGYGADFLLARLWTKLHTQHCCAALSFPISDLLELLNTLAVSYIAYLERPHDFI